MQLILGMQCAHHGSLARSPARLARLAHLVVDPRWVYRFKLVQVGYLPTMASEPRFPGVTPVARLEGAALQALESPSAESVSFSISKIEAGDHADLFVDTGRHAPYAPNSPQFAHAKWRVPDDATAETAAAAWVALQHEIVETVGATNGVIVTSTNPYVIGAERWLSLTSIDGKVMHPHPDEITSYASKRYELGHKYIRKPRWGTYLKPEHVDAVGGRAAIVERVNPPVIRDVGNLLYVQLSERIEDATADDTRRRWRAFVDLVAPITLPPLLP